MQFEGEQYSPNVWEAFSLIDSQGVEHQLIRPKSLQHVMTSAQMKWEYLSILYEAQGPQSPYGSVRFGTEESYAIEFG
jgi:hypothetical protein